MTVRSILVIFLPLGKGTVGVTQLATAVGGFVSPRKLRMSLTGSEGGFCAPFGAVLQPGQGVVACIIPVGVANPPATEPIAYIASPFLVQSPSILPASPPYE